MSGHAVQPIPFSEFDGTLAEFQVTLAWSETPLGQRQQGADSHLLTAIAARLRTLGNPYDRTDETTHGKLADLAEDELEEILDEVEGLHPGMFGDPTLTARERLSAHWAPSQALKLERRREMERFDEIRQRDLQLTQLQNLRIGISMARERIAENEALIADLEPKLAALAGDLGEPAWP